MSVCLDRFSVGLPDQQEQLPEFLGGCLQCSELIYEGDEYTEFDGDVFCNDHCFARWMGAKEVS